jgi:ATP-binding cassette subfamily B protein
MTDASTKGRIRAVYRFFGPFLKPYLGRIILAYSALAAVTAATLLRPWPLKLILDCVILEGRTLTESLPFIPPVVDTWDRYTLLTALSIALVVIVLLESIFGYAQKVLFAEIGQSATTDVLEHTFTHLQTLPRSEGKEARTGDVIYRLTSDMKTLRDLLVNHVQRLGSYALTFVSTIAVMAYLNWRLTLLALIVVPFIFVASYRFSTLIRRATKEKRKKEGEVASIVQETLQSMAVVQAFAQEDRERRRFRQEARESLDAGLESVRLGGAFTRSLKVMNTVGAALVIWFGASQVLKGTLSPGDLVVFAAYVTELYVPIQNVAELAVQFMEALVSGERVLDLVGTVPRIKDAPNARKAPRFEGVVEFESVVAGYVPGSPVLNAISFRAEPKRMIALVGGSGAGKSTVLNLLLRFLDPWEGRVLIDGSDVRGFRLQSLRSQISVVFQESVLFRRSVHENIAYGKPGAKVAEVEAAARAAKADEFIQALPEGYDTILDEQGSNLSGGQRQRLALARAFLRNAPILVLDEPSSGLDAVTEAQLSETIDELAQGRTTIVIAHRLSTVERADRILVLDRGRIAEEGRHEELLQRGGLYRALYDAQATEVF